MGKGQGKHEGRAALAVHQAYNPQRIEGGEMIRGHPQLMGHKVACLRLVGSHAYGLATTYSDMDFRGVYIAPTHQILSVSDRPPENIEIRHEPDLVVYEVDRFARLAMAANPNVLELLWAPAVGTDSEEGAWISEQRDIFLSQRARATYSGYAIQQARKLQRVAADRPEKKEKYARHLFRLFEQGRQVLEEGSLEIHVRDPERLQSMSKWPVAKIIKQFDRLQSEFDQLESPLPQEPNYEAINALLIKIRRANFADD